MNNSNIHIGFREAALVVLLAFLLPTAISFTHLASGHQHYDTCATSDTHVHESQLDCHLDNLHFVKVGFFAFAKAETLLKPAYFKTKTFTPQKSYSQIAIVSTTRGPPFV